MKYSLTLLGANVTVAYHSVGALPQGLDAVELSILDGDVVGVPQGSPTLVRQLAVPNGQPVVVPEGVTQVEKAVLHLNVRTLLKGALPVGGAVKGAVPHQQLPAAVQDPLLLKGLILNSRHSNSSNIYGVQDSPARRFSSW